jgi:hypothetical protein
MTARDAIDVAAQIWSGQRHVEAGLARERRQLIELDIVTEYAR